MIIRTKISSLIYMLFIYKKEKKYSPSDYMKSNILLYTNLYFKFCYEFDEGFFAEKGGGRLIRGERSIKF